MYGSKEKIQKVGRWGTNAGEREVIKNTLKLPLPLC